VLVGGLMVYLRAWIVSDMHRYNAYLYYKGFGLMLLIGLFLGGTIGSLFYSYGAKSPLVILGGMIGGALLLPLGKLVSDLASEALADRLMGRESLERYPEIYYNRDLSRAKGMFRDGYYDDALEVLLDLMDKTPDRAEPLFLAAKVCHTGTKDYNRAMKLYTDLVERFEDTLGENHMYIIESKRNLDELGGPGRGG